MTKKNKDQELLVVSEFFVKAVDFETRYKALKKTIKSIRKFKEAQIRGKIAEA
ncbi:MAG: hypothetical protein PHR98_02615 [Candidatus Shapirobacteria bacterium]|jgi:hypothetical protein|nr:hypothetical protein [Candidatus Shapirobacteria bacterium]